MRLSVKLYTKISFKLLDIKAKTQFLVFHGTAGQ